MLTEAELNYNWIDQRFLDFFVTTNHNINRQKKRIKFCILDLEFEKNPKWENKGTNYIAIRSYT